MTTPNEENERPKAQDNANPFVAFRRFADNQVSTFMSGVFSISSLFASPSTAPHRSTQDYEKWLLEAPDSSQRLACEADEAQRIMDVYTKAHKECQHSILGGIHIDNRGPPRCPYRPAEQDSAQLEDPPLKICLPVDDASFPSSLAALSLRLPSPVPAALVLGDQPPSVPIAYLLYSPYSPLQLEQEPRLCDHGGKWREAFQDLLAVQNGQDLPHKGQQRVCESGVDWLRGMVDLAMCNRVQASEGSSSANGNTSEALKQDIGLLLRLFRARQTLRARQIEHNADRNEDADNNDVYESGDAEVPELDIYDRLFGSQQLLSENRVRAVARTFAHPQEDSRSDKDSKVPCILSTLTTTERTTLRDGSLHTKVVLKKRFSDGREESTETVNHQNAVRQTQDAASKSFEGEDDTRPAQERGSKENRPSGWFWT